MTDQATTTPTAQPCRTLALDGGGAKGFYTLGVLKQLEALTGPLHERFDLIFGTSTRAIIAALLALGKPVSEVRELYRKHVPRVMRLPHPSLKIGCTQAPCGKNPAAFRSDMTRLLVAWIRARSSGILFLIWRNDMGTIWGPPLPGRQ